MTSGLVNASFSLPEWQAVKMIFFPPCSGRLRADLTFQLNDDLFLTQVILYNRSCTESQGSNGAEKAGGL